VLERNFKVLDADLPNKVFAEALKLTQKPKKDILDLKIE
jgi:hypothetical protein